MGYSVSKPWKVGWGTAADCLFAFYIIGDFCDQFICRVHSFLNKVFQLSVSGAAER
jgi:hypothetical protein